MDLTTLLIIAVVALVVIGALGFVVARRRRRVYLPPTPEPLDRPAPDLDLDDGRVAVAESVPADVVVEPAPAVKPSFFDRLTKARSAFTGYLGGLVGLARVGEDEWEELEEALIRADVGVKTSMNLIAEVRSRAAETRAEGGAEVLEILKARMHQELVGKDRSLRLDEGETNVWLFVGVNGVGKTTTIGKMGKRLFDEGHRPLMAAGDTFRAAAAEQLTMWAERSGAGIVRGNEGGDPSSVIFDAVQAAAARNCDVVLADTAGRLHNKANLMDELSKVRRVAAKEPGHVTEVLLVLDATTGQNGLSQAKVFTEAVEVTGVVLTKLDGSAKGGIVFAIESELGLPVKLVGLGEGVDDLVDFSPSEFVDALFE
ncbi:MAG: signal recognition particle-docking protein FtsY [Acidimicrobiia bacterium]|nr:signal recognition particle-docking protein FtsY [Acidimicrobiia bacterium]